MPLRSPQVGPKADYDQILDWVRRHNSSDHYEVLDRFAEHYNLSKLDRARLKRLLKEQEARVEAARALLARQRV